jgi:DNA-binding MarR family transcriptional regulator
MSSRSRRQLAHPPLPAADLETADRLHSAAIRLLRRLRAVDETSGLSAPRLSALSAIVFGGPLRLSTLAGAEQVRRPTITRLVQQLERAGLVERLPDTTDRRATRVRATTRGKRVLGAARRRRVMRLASALALLTVEERALLARATDLLGRVIDAERGRRPS